MPAVRFHTSSLFPHLGNGEESGTNIMELPWGRGKSVQDSVCTTASGNCRCYNYKFPGKGKAFKNQLQRFRRKLLQHLNM